TPGGAREAGGKIPSVVALDLGKIVRILHRVVVCDGERGQPVVRWIGRQARNPEVPENIGAERIGRQIVNAQPREREASFVHPRRARKRASDGGLLRAQILHGGKRGKRSRQYRAL